MAMVCPKCNGSFEQRWQCPTCGVRLAYQSGHRPNLAVEAPSSPWGQTPWGRILVGVVLSQGLYYGLRQFATAGLLMGGEQSAHSVWSTITGLIVLQGIQGLCLIVAGMLAGAGLRQGVVFGGIVGVWNGLLSVVVQSLSGWPFTAVTLLSQPILHTAVGAAGGFLGSRIWKPLPILAGPSTPQVAPPIAPAQLRRAVLGTVRLGPYPSGRCLGGRRHHLAHAILEMVLEASNGTLDITDHLQASLVTWEVTGLAMLAGSALAGAGTANSLKQGLGVGAAVAIALLGFCIGIRHDTLDDLILTVACSVALGLVGAWFGGSLFPPLDKRLKHKRLGPQTA